MVKKIRGTSDEVLNPFKDSLVRNFSKKETKEVKRWATNQAYLALGNLLSYCALEKIDSCPMEGFVPEAYDKLLKLNEKGLNSVLVLPVGYRDKSDMFAEMKKVRKPLNQSIIEIE
jgi:nitroreductase